MFAIQTPQNQPNFSETEHAAESCNPNILPCRIHHDGPVDSLQRYWAPVTDGKDRNIQTSHFRGRKLRGRRVAVPEGYNGVVAMPTDRILPPTQKHADVMTDDAEERSEEPVKVLEQQATFNEFTVWDHEAVPTADDPFVKGLEEWVKLAEAMHSSMPSTKEAEKAST